MMCEHHYAINQSLILFVHSTVIHSNTFARSFIRLRFLLKLSALLLFFDRKISKVNKESVIKSLIICITDMPPVKDESIREGNCLDIINIAEKSPAKSGALVDVRACNKPSAKVRSNLQQFCNFLNYFTTTRTMSIGLFVSLYQISSHPGFIHLFLLSLTTEDNKQRRINQTSINTHTLDYSLTRTLSFTTAPFIFVAFMIFTNIQNVMFWHGIFRKWKQNYLWLLEIEYGTHFYFLYLILHTAVSKYLCKSWYCYYW